MKNITNLILCLLIGYSGFAQDKIYKKDKSIITCKVVDIGLNEIKYLESDLDDGPTISIGVDDLIKIVLSNGRVIEFKNPLTDPASYVDDKKKAIKLHFLSPLSEHLSISFEKSIKPGRSFESTIGFIGIGFDTNIDSKSSGLALSGGYKFMRTPDFYTQRYKYAHIMKGAYIKPELLLSMYHNEYNNYFFNTPNPQQAPLEQDIVAGAIIINIGKQVVYDNLFVIDYSFGLCYGFSNQGRNDFGESDGWRPNHYGFLLGDKSIPIAASLKVKIGLLW
jgi:hypothetical protein